MLLRTLFFHLAVWNAYSLNTLIYLYSMCDKLRFEINQALCGNSYAGSGTRGHPWAWLSLLRPLGLSPPAPAQDPMSAPQGHQPLPQQCCSNPGLQLPPALPSQGLCELLHFPSSFFFFHSFEPHSYEADTSVANLLSVWMIISLNTHQKCKRAHH